MFLMFWIIISNMLLVPGMFFFSAVDVFTLGNKWTLFPGLKFPIMSHTK
jgi:hypothetical protein